MRLTDQVMDFIPRSFYAFPLPQKKKKKRQMIIKRTDLRPEKKRADFLFFFTNLKLSRQSASHISNQIFGSGVEHQRFERTQRRRMFQSGCEVIHIGIQLFTWLVENYWSRVCFL